MAPKCYVSYKSADFYFREEIALMGVCTASNSFDGSADYDDERIAQKLRDSTLKDIPVTLFLIGAHSAETLGWEKQKYIKRELQASMLPCGDGLPGFILGIVLPAAYNCVFHGGEAQINDKTVVREFSAAYNRRRSCALIRWDVFNTDPNQYILEAYAARFVAGGQKKTNA